MAVIERTNVINGALVDPDSFASTSAGAYGPYTNAGAPTNGGSGTQAGNAAPGALLIDVTNKALYINSNTKASPTWSLVTSAVITVPQTAIADAAAATVGTNIAAFTDPPSAAEMALLRTFVNALKTDHAAVLAKFNTLLAELRTAGVIAP